MVKERVLGLALGASLLFGLAHVTAAAPVAKPSTPAAQSSVVEVRYVARRTTVRRGGFVGHSTTVARRGAVGYGGGYRGYRYYPRPGWAATGAAVATGTAVRRGTTVVASDPISTIIGAPPATIGGSCVGGRLCRGGYFYRGGARVCRSWTACY